MNTELKLHPLCEIFPEMSPEEFADIVTDMKLNGFHKDKKIITLDGKILDGRNRLHAAEAAGVKPMFKKFDGKSPLDFVVMENINRRNLSASQRAMIAAELTKQSASGGEVVTEKAAAKKMNVSRQSVAVAKKVKKKSPWLAAKVKAGKISLHKAEIKILPRNDGPRDYSSAYTSEPVRKETRSLGQIGYEAYLSYMGEGEAWDDLTVKQRAAWAIAAKTIKEKS